MYNQQGASLTRDNNGLDRNKYLPILILISNISSLTNIRNLIQYYMEMKV